MTAFEFMANSFFVAVGLICLSIAGLVVWSAVAAARKVGKTNNETET